MFTARRLRPQSRLPSPSPEGPRPSSHSSGQLAVVTFSHAVQHFYPAGLAVAYPFVVTSLHVSYALLGAVVGAAGVVGGLLQGLAGLFKSFSARLLLCLQNLGLALACVIGAAAPGFALFGVARLFGSVVSWPQHPVGSSVLSRDYPDRRAFALSWHVAGGSVGTAVVPLLVSAVIAAYGWRWGVGIVAVPLALGGLVVAWKLAGPPADRAPAERQDATTLVELLHRRDVLAALVAGTVAAGGRGLGTISTFVPAYLHSGLHLSALLVGGLYTVLLVGSIGGPVAIGHLADRLGRRRVLVTVYVIAAATIVGYVSVGAGVFQLALVGLLVGIFAYAESPLIQAVFSEVVQGAEEQASFGLFFAISYGVGSVWTVLLGWVIDRFGFHAAFVVMAASFVLAGLVVAFGASGGPKGLEPNDEHRGQTGAGPEASV